MKEREKKRVKRGEKEIRMEERIKRMVIGVYIGGGEKGGVGRRGRGGRRRRRIRRGRLGFLGLRRYR